ncbi:MAG: methyltransferase domain-containing protein [Helicobacteraceae bacterium]|nr:methyltransferase domain-containing protein [Helicobacteraceae bacterium]
MLDIGQKKDSSNVSSEKLRELHWEKLFKKVDYTQVLWHQLSPKMSFELVEKNSENRDAKIVDVGCGASLLVDTLLENKYKNITLLDTSKTSLEIVQNRVKSNIPIYVNSDILNFQSETKFDIWHDRAVFHFLLKRSERVKYFNVLLDSLKDNGVAIINTFAINGATQCAGLNIAQYDEEKMAKELPKELKIVEYKEFTHHTPKATTQKYCSFVIKKV